ncbi:hypothetical protein, partial [Pseudomonas viridiflava]|uniref:hypothetical protein n=1 Tax=Pseudomonas viridiflava TaxID=33069 RepID=UPI0019D1FA82
LRDRSWRSGSGLLRCTSFRCVWLRQTVAALHARINPSTQPADGLPDQDQDQKLLELALIVEWCGFAAGSCAAFAFCGSEPAREGGLTADLFL